jgi:hypothetical protein
LLKINAVLEQPISKFKICTLLTWIFSHTSQYPDRIMTFLQAVPSLKSPQFGIKTFEFCNSGTYYVWVFTIYIQNSEVKEAIMMIRDKKATRDDDIPGSVLRLLDENGLKKMTQLINNTHETGEWPKDFLEVTMTALKKSEATNCSNHHTYSKDSNEDTNMIEKN